MPSSRHIRRLARSRLLATGVRRSSQSNGTSSLPRSVVEAPGIEGLKRCRRKPSRDVYLTNHRPTSLTFFVPSGSTLFPRNSSLPAESRQ